MKNKENVRRFKKMEQKYILGIVALAMIAILGVGMVSALGYAKGLGFMNQDLSDEEKTQMQEQRNQMQTAIENGDYAAWKSLMEAQVANRQSQITEENFNKIVEQHQQRTELRTAMEEARESGDYTQVQELQKELGVGRGFGMGRGDGFGMGSGPKHAGGCPMDTDE
jgi:hypothetical protein